MNLVYNEGLIRKIVRSVFAHLLTIDMTPEPTETHTAMQLTGLGAATVLLARRMGLTKTMFVAALSAEWEAMDSLEAKGGKVDISEIKVGGKSSAN